MTQVAIFKLKGFIEERLFRDLDLTMVQCPLIVRGGVGINDDLNGTERPVSFDLEKSHVEIVQSLAKWKRMALSQYELSGHLDIWMFIVRKIFKIYREAMEYVKSEYPEVGSKSLPDDIFFITTQELEDLYPSLTPQEREFKICEQKGAVFVQKIGGLLKSGEKHDGRAPDYDDHELNGDICFWFPTLGIPFEISSMGIRVE